MDYRYLKAFLLTVEHGSFSKAAEEMDVAQSAISRQIKLLEEDIGFELIIRSSKKIILTEKGRSLYIALQTFDQTSKDIFQTEEKEPLRVGILQGLLKNWFIPRVQKYYKKNNRSLSIEIGDKATLRKGLEEGKLDIIFSTDEIQTELISSLKLFDEKLVLISKDEINRKKLNEYRWIVYGSEDPLFVMSKKVSESIVSVSDIPSILDLVKLGVGIAIVPDHVLKKTDGVIHYDLPGLPKSEIYMTTLNFKSMPQAIKDLAENI
ncbi:MAG: LysR family transcriptional regulator [Bacteriovoracaceae bacterium]